MNLPGVCLADALVTGAWLIASSCIGIMTRVLLHTLPVLSEVVVALLLLSILLVLFDLFCTYVIPGTSFNPATGLAYLVGGLTSDTPVLITARLLAQAAGAAAGAVSLVYIIPEMYHHLALEGCGLQPQVTVWEGATVEGLLSFTICLVCLWATPPPPLWGWGVVKASLPLLATIGLVLVGEPYTGAVMNPAVAFGHAFRDNAHTTVEHITVYWGTPMIGAVLAGLVFRLAKGAPAKAKQMAEKKEL